MNKFIQKALLFCAPVLVFMLIMELLLRNIPNDYSYKKNYLDQHSNEIEILLLGSSHAYRAINPEFIHSNSFNAAHIAQSIDYDIQILKKYANQTNKLKFIVIPIDYFTFYNRLETGVESWRIKNYNIYYGFNRSYNCKDNLEILNGKLLENSKRIVKFYWRKKSDISCKPLGWGAQKQSQDDKNLLLSGKAAAQRHAKKDKSFFYQNVAIVNEIIALAKAKNAKVIFYTSPAYKTYTSQLNKEQLQKTYTTIKKIAHSNPNVRYYDFLSDPSFIKEDFYDADHLNEIGAEKFSKKMDSIIINLK
jgi:hypothetical protein